MQTRRVVLRERGGSLGAFARRRRFLLGATATRELGIPPLARAVRLARSWGVLGLVLALAVVTGASETMAQQTRTINLNSGFDQANSALLAVGEKDNEWRVIVDPTPPPEPPGNGVSTGRPADVVCDPSWGFPTCLDPSLPNSAWISINPNRYPGPSPPTDFKYAFYFTLPPGFSSPQLTMKLKADDHITDVTLNNNCNLFTGSGGIFINPPLVIPPFTTQTCFNSGPVVNVLTVTVQDTARGITGLRVEGAVTYDDCDRLPIKDIPGLSGITFWESTGASPTPFLIPVGPTSPLNTRIVALGPGAGNSDFQGVSGAEFYDVFYSLWDGTPSLTGDFVTIEAVFCSGAPFGGGLNIARVDFNGTPRFANSVASFAALGDNAILSGPLGVGDAVDVFTSTDSTMGNTCFPPPPPPPATQRLRLTVGFPCDTDAIPTVSEWGMVVISLLLLTGIAIKFGRQRAASVSD